MPFEALREDLLRAGVSPRRVRRYLRELESHLFDLTEQEITAGHDRADASVRARALLGGDSELAEGWLREPELKSMVARAPWLVFTLLPLAAIMLATMIQFLSFVALLHGFGIIGHHSDSPHVFPVLTNIMVLIGNLGVIPATVALFVLIAWRQRMTFLWPLTSALIVMLLFLHWGTDPILREPLGQSAFRLALGRHFSTNVLNISAMPVFLSAWRQQFAAHAPLFLAEYILILLPVGWLFGAQKSSSTAGATLRDH